MFIVNFDHPLTTEQTTVLAERFDRELVIRVVRCQIDLTESVVHQAIALVDAAGLSPEEWQTEPIAVLLPAMTAVSASVLAEMHGRMGHYPMQITRRQQDGVFVIWEVIDLDTTRNMARARR